MFLYILTKFRNIALQPVGPLKLDLVARFARGSCMLPGLGQRPTLVNTQGPIRLRHACYVTVAGQRAAAASQLAVIGLLPAVAPTDLRSWQQKYGPICTQYRAFLEKFHYFRNDNSYRHKTQHMSCKWSSRVSLKKRRPSSTCAERCHLGSCLELQAITKLFCFT